MGKQLYEFGPFSMDPEREILLRAGEPVPLTPKTFQILLVLVRHSQEVVTKDDLMKAVWPDTFVEEANLSRNIFMLRKALGESPPDRRYIVTVPGRGYRLADSAHLVVEQELTIVAANRSKVQVEVKQTKPWGQPLANPWTWIAMVVSLLVVTGMWLFLSPSRKRPGPVRIIPFSGLSGVEDYPAFSPDGKQLAYAWDGGAGSPSHIYVKLVGAGTPVQLTHDSLSDGDPAWSPDGRYIAFIRYSPGWNGKSEVISIPALGGPERRLADVNVPADATRDLTWSPDGKSVAIGDRPSPAEQGAFLVSSENGEKHRLTSPPPECWGDSDPAFSPEGRTLAFVRWSGNYVGDIYVQRTNATEARRLTFDETRIQGLAWMPDGRNIVFSSWRSGLSTLWRVPVSGGEIEALAGIGEDTKVPALSSVANLLAYRKLEKNVNIWSVHLSPAGRLEGPPRRLISASREQHDDEFSPDGRRIVFSSNRSGNDEIWVANADGSNATPLTSFRGPLTGTPRWSPDGRWIAFDSRSGGRTGIFLVSAEGGAPRRLTPPAADAFVPSWSRDGRWIYFCWNREGDLEIWKMPAEGGEPVQVTKTGGFEARESNDGKWLYFSRPPYRPPYYLVGRTEKFGIWRKPIEGGAEKLVLDKLANRLWTLAREYLYFMDVDAESHATINRLDLATGEITRMAKAEKDPSLTSDRTGLSVSPDGQWIIYPQVDERILRIMLVENIRW